MPLAVFPIAELIVILVGALFLALIAGSCMMWTRAGVKLIEGRPLLEFEPRRRVPWGLFDLLLVLLMMIFLVVAVQGTMIWLGPVPDDPPVPERPPGVDRLLAGSLAMLLGCALAVFLLRVRTGAGWEDIGFRGRDFLRDVRIGAGAFVMLAPPMYLLQFLLTRFWFRSEHPIQTIMLEDPNVAVLLAVVFTAVIVAPLAEEIFFRVIFQGWLENLSLLFSRLWRGKDADQADVATTVEDDIRITMIGEPGQKPPSGGHPPQSDNPYASFTQLPATADLPTEPVPSDLVVRRFPTRLSAIMPIAVSALVFALLHAGHGPDPIPLFFLAVGLGYLYQRTHRAVSCIVVHFLVNGFSTLLLLIGLLAGQEPPL